MGADGVSEDAGGGALDGEVDARRAASSSSSGSTHHRRSASSSSCSTHHRRSKSASDRSMDFTKHEASSCMGKSPIVFQKLMETTRVQKAQGPSRQDCSGKDYDAVSHDSHHHASLENDIKQLQMCLHREKSVRAMLEKAIGRSSSTLSPGHKNFATQTRKLIEEIELLEEEVANREQHVLSLYRAIFDQSVGGALSEQSSGRAYPPHTRNRIKKHPSVISCALCSSRKFPVQRFRVLRSIKDSWKKSMLTDTGSRHASVLSANANVYTGECCSDTIKVNEETPIATKHYFFRAVRDHLYQYPNKLSEELVKCMVAVYCLACSEPSIKPDKGHSPLLSRTSTNVVLPQRVTEDDKDWPCRSMVEISWISTDMKQLSSASYAISNYRSFVEQLQRVDIDMLESNAKLAFWINVYNSLVMHAYLAFGISRSSLKRIALFHKAAYNIGGHVISANFIEHDILCCRTPRTGRVRPILAQLWFDTMISTAMRKRSGEDKFSSRISFMPSQPIICFSLCTGAYSDPMLKVYTAKNVREELEEAKKEFLQANVIIKRTSKVFLPKLLDRYAKEASISSDDLLAWVSENVDKKLHDTIQKCMDSHPKRKTSQIIEWLPYDPRFRYIFGKDLTEKAW